jgi:carboxylesterase type B
MFSPEYLLMENVIVVSINYRLHALGFLMLPSMGINGNAGLKDQQMALEWVYENIEQFNGDRERICLFGESAGGASVHFQVLNEKSRKMISSAVCQSGSAVCDWALQRDSLGCTKRLAELLGCKSSNDKEIYDTLVSAPLEELFRKTARANSNDDRRRNLNMTFKPVIELNSSDAFMTKSPIELMIAQKDKINIPLIFGCTNKEGIIQTSFMKKNFAAFNKDVSKLIPISLNVDPDSALALEVGKEIKNFYLDGGLDDEHEENFIDLMTDLHFLTPQTMCNELNAKYQKNKQYLYEFRFDGELNVLKKIVQMDHCKGACHADELYYLFGYALYLNFKILN